MLNKVPLSNKKNGKELDVPFLFPLLQESLWILNIFKFKEKYKSVDFDIYAVEIYFETN